jgi:MOSC domain-containing protein YiiM
MKLEAIYVWPVSRGNPVALDRVSAVAGVGLDGDRQRGKKRQVTLLDADAWADATREAGSDAPPVRRRANLVLRGVPLAADSIGRRLRIGDVVLLVRGETTPCHRMDDIHPGLRDAMKPAFRGGVFCSIETGGTLSVGDSVSVL